jgi:molybdate transport system substrate-binding protein
MIARTLFTWVVSLAFFAVCQDNPAIAADESPVVVFAAASTSAALEAIAQEYEKQSGQKIEIVPGPSSGLARQIQQGADADLFLSADQANADVLEAKGLLAMRRDLLTNRLIVIVSADSTLPITKLSDLDRPDVRRLAIAEASVPAGRYARQALKAAGLPDSLDKRFVEGIDVKATLQYVSRGEVDAGLVYASDAVGNAKVRVAVEIDPTLHEPIEYPLVLLMHDPPRPAAQAFFDYLRTAAAEKVFSERAFGVAAE